MHWLVFRDPAIAATSRGADGRRRDLDAIFGVVPLRSAAEAQQPPNGGIAPRGPLSRNA